MFLIDSTRLAVRLTGEYWLNATVASPPIVMYHYAQSRLRAVVEDLLDGYRGILVTDGHAAYDTVPAGDAGCWTDARRKFTDALKAQTGGHTSAALYSPVETAKANDLEPTIYLHWLFATLPCVDPVDADAISALLPYRVDRDRIASDLAHEHAHTPAVRDAQVGSCLETKTPDRVLPIRAYPLAHP